jgi:hypothetical protein
LSIKNTGQFARYFLAPGVAHCGTPGTGNVAPANPMQQVIDWVPLPRPDAVCTGGNPAQASSYTCRPTPRFTSPFTVGTAT